MHRAPPLLLLLFLAGACGSPTPRDSGADPAIDVEAELAGIEATRSAFMAAIREGRYQDLGDLVTADLNTVGPGHPDWQRMYAIGADPGVPFPYDSIVMTPNETVLVSEGIAYDFGNSVVYFTNGAGEVEQLRNAYLAILEKGNDGVWRLHREVAAATTD
jgi:ketosteroid isomerase-like protein